LYNGRSKPGEHFRVFPLSNWTELDVWQYIEQEGVEIPSLYLAHERTMFERDGVLLPKSPYNEMREGEEYVEKMVRFRTIGDMTCTGAVESTATTVEQVIAEVATTQQAERGARADDKRAEAAMEERKREGYF
ncbi:MAG: phosphoadenosine phosphosulfate reductase family protein, partial [Salinibacter sp.]